MPHYVRLDKGTETEVLATMHAYLRRQQCDVDNDDEVCDTVIYGPSTSNQTSIRNYNFQTNLETKDFT